MYATAAAVAAGAPSALLASGPPSSRSPNERLGVAVMGVRGRGNSHLAAYAGRRDTEVRAICEVDPIVGQKRVDETGKRQRRRPRLVSDLRRVLDDPTIDIVSIATPNHWHALAAIWAMQAGKDVYLETPASHYLSEGPQIARTAQQYGRICQTGTQCRSNPGMVDAMRFLHGGGVGPIHLARGLCYKRRGAIGPTGDYRPPTGLDLDLWLGPAPEAPITRPRFHHDWHWQWAYGNGELGNQAVHQMDIARWGLNRPGLSQAVVSFGGRYGHRDAGETANTQMVIHDFAEASLVLEIRGLPTRSGRGGKVGVVFEGSDGFVVLASYTGGAAFDRDGHLIRSFAGSGDHFGNFLAAVRSRNPDQLSAPANEGHLSAALCHMGNISYRLGQEIPLDAAADSFERLQAPELAQRGLDRLIKHVAGNRHSISADAIRLGLWLAFDPDSETFTDNQAANKLLGAEYREPFAMPAV